MKEEIKTIVVKVWDEEMRIWEKSVDITYWEHDYEQEIYIVKYKEKE